MENFQIVKICSSKVAKIDGEKKRQTGQYLPIQAKFFIWSIWTWIVGAHYFQVGDTKFPLPDNNLLAGKAVKSVVLVLPDNYKLWPATEN